MDLALALHDAKPNDTISIPGGRYTGVLELTKPVTLLARGQVVLDAKHAGPCLRIRTDGLVRISGCTIVGGDGGEGGGGIALLSGSLELSDCVVRFNKAPAYGGGGLYVGGGSALVSRCRFEANTGRQGGGILVDEDGELRLEHSTLIQNAAVEGGGLRAKEGAKVTVFACTIADNKVVGDAANGAALHVSGTTTRAPTVSVSNSIISERARGPSCIFNWPKHPGALTITRSLLPEWSKGLGTDCLYGAAGFALEGVEPYLLSASSPAIGKADPAAFAPGSKDVTGRPCARGMQADLGAFAFAPRSSSAIGY
ncbi:MAG: right-handed parallel beta-helix repeat-containing protein [Myxococcus sp.]|nr:right-handed parallel beta-helix repeat-containing protein [Myxococcus sp.]